MKVGTDGVLLGSWVLLPSAGGGYRLLDIGAGTGIIALMLAQRLSPITADFQIHAIEIDTAAAQQAAANCQASPWGRQIDVLPLSLAQYQEKEQLYQQALQLDKEAVQQALPLPKYDLIISNPPFYNATLKPEDEARAIARHKDALPVADIAQYAAQHLTQKGRLALIYPIAYDSEVMTATVLAGLHPVRLCDVLTKVGKPCKRRMAEFSPLAQPIVNEQLAIRDAKGIYTPEYLALTEAFYLHLND